MSLMQLIKMAPQRIARAHRQYAIKHAISRTQRELELTQREIANSLEVKRHLQQEMMCLRRELNSI